MMPPPDKESLIETLFPTGEVPQRDWVLSQAIRVDVADLRSRLPVEEMWPPEFDRLATGNGKYRLVTRKIVFDIADRAAKGETPWAAAQLHVACVAWGTSPGRTLSRALRPLYEPDAAEKLVSALQLVHTEGALSAYRALHAGGRLKVHNLSVGFFTKFLYFAGYNSKPLLGRPLIYDSNVAAAMRRITCDQRWVDKASTDIYSQYLDICADWAQDLDTDPDVIERALFGR